MSYIYQVDGYLNGKFVSSETFTTKEEAQDKVDTMRYQGGLDKITLETRDSLTQACYTKKVWLWQPCGRWDKGTLYHINEGARAESKLTLKYRRV